MLLMKRRQKGSKSRTPKNCQWADFLSVETNTTYHHYHQSLHSVVTDSRIQALHHVARSVRNRVRIRQSSTVPAHTPLFTGLIEYDLKSAFRIQKKNTWIARHRETVVYCQTKSNPETDPETEEYKAKNKKTQKLPTSLADSLHSCIQEGSRAAVGIQIDYIITLLLPSHLIHQHTGKR